MNATPLAIHRKVWADTNSRLKRGKTQAERYGLVQLKKFFLKLNGISSTALTIAIARGYQNEQDNP